MIRVNYDQGSETWLKWRQGGLGGSDAASILNVAPAYWQNANRAALLAYKIVHHGKAIPRTTNKNKSFAMMRGTLMEPEARMAYREKTGHNVEPACGIHEKYDFLRASFDGLNKDGSLAIEIKCINQDDHEVALGGLVPSHYWPQVQHLLLVSGAPRLHYFSYSKARRFAQKDLQVLVPVIPSRAYQELLLAEEVKFWDELMAAVAQRKKKS